MEVGATNMNMKVLQTRPSNCKVHKKHFIDMAQLQIAARLIHICHGSRSNMNMKLLQTMPSNCKIHKKHFINMARFQIVASLIHICL
jgi:hypothetical protein